MTDEVTGPIEVRPRCDMEANETNGKEVENNAVRPKSDIDAEAFDEVAKKNKHDNENGKILEVNDEVSKEDVEIRMLIEERRNTSVCTVGGCFCMWCFG